MTDDFFTPPPPEPRWPLQEELEQPPVSAFLTPAEVSALQDMTLEQAAEWIVARIKEES